MRNEYIGSLTDVDVDVVFSFEFSVLVFPG